MTASSTRWHSWDHFTPILHQGLLYDEVEQVQVRGAQPELRVRHGRSFPVMLDYMLAIRVDRGGKDTNVDVCK